MLNIIAGGAGCGKSTLMMKNISDAVKNGRNVYIIIPDQFSFEYDRLLYKYLGIVDFNKVTILSFTRLAEQIFIKYGGIKGKYANDTVKSVYLYYAIENMRKQEKLDFFTRQANSNGFVDNCLKIINELVTANISPEMLTDKSILFKGSLKEKIEGITNIYTEYTRLLHEKGFKDNIGDISEAARRAKTYQYFKDTDVFIDEFKSFTADELSFLDTIISDANSVNICLTTEDKTNITFSVFETVNDTISKLKQIAYKHSEKFEMDFLESGVRFKAKEIGFLSKNILRNSMKIYNDECSNINIFEAEDLYNEVDFVCTKIRSLVMENDYKYSDIAVISRNKEEYTSIIESACKRYDIPYYSDEKTLIKNKALIIYIMSALRIASNKNADTEDFLRYIKSFYSSFSETQIDTIEEYCYKWNVTPKMWESEFIDEDAESLRMEILEPIHKFRDACSENKGSVCCKSFFDFLNEVGVTARIKSSIKACENADVDVLTSAREAKQLWELLCGIIESIHSVILDMNVSLADFYKLFESAISQVSLSSPPQTLDSVTFVAAHTARTANPKVVFVIGVNDGILPFASKASGILTERDRITLNQNGILLGGNISDKVAEERFVAYNTFSAPSEKLYISYPISDISGKSRYPSMLIKQTLAILPNITKTVYSDVGLLSFCMTPHSAYYQLVQGFNIKTSESETLRKALSGIDEYNKKIKHLDRLKENKKYTLDKAIGDNLFGKKLELSYTSFETYQKCPFKYFCQYGLKLHARKRIETNPAFNGNVIHFCLNDLFAKINSTGRNIINIDDNEIADMISLSMKAYYESDEVKSKYGKTERFNTTYKLLKNTILQVAVRLKDEFANVSFKPADFEYEFGKSYKETPLTLTSSDGTQIVFRGKIDRIDTFQNGDDTYIRVVDYKTGTVELTLANLLYGINTQMFLYLFALTESADEIKKSGKYKSMLPAGVLYMPATEVSPKKSRYSSEESLKKHINDTYKMKCMLVDSKDVIDAMMPQNDSSNNLYLSLSFNKDGSCKSTAGGSVLGSEQLMKLRDHCKNLLTQMADNLKSGEVAVSPYVNGETKACKYCDYSAVCNISDFPENAREIDKNTAEITMKESLGMGDKDAE